jgi:hypothetical protein
MDIAPAAASALMARIADWAVVGVVPEEMGVVLADEPTRASEEN